MNVMYSSRGEIGYIPLPLNLSNRNHSQNHYFHLNNVRRSQDQRDYSNIANLYNYNNHSASTGFKKGILATASGLFRNNNRTRSGNLFTSNSGRPRTQTANNFHFTSIPDDKDAIRKSKTAGKFKFKKYFGSDTKFDIDELLAKNDLAPLENILEGLIYSKYEHENVDLEHLVKNFQQTAEYLFEMQTNLENENQEMEENYKVLQNNAGLLEEELRTNKDIIHHYKDAAKELKYRLNIYKTVIDEHRGASKEDKHNNNRNSRIAYYFCDKCAGRKFSNAERLHEHYQRRHPGVISNTNIVETVLENKMSKLKNELTASMGNFHKDNLNQLMENNYHLEKKIEEMKYDGGNTGSKLYHEDEIDMKRIIEEIKKMNNSNGHGHGDNADLDEKLKKKTKKIYKAVKDLEKNQNDKIEDISEKLAEFRESVINELRGLKAASPSKESVNVRESRGSTNSKVREVAAILEEPKTKGSFVVKSYMNEKKIKKSNVTVVTAEVKNPEFETKVEVPNVETVAEKNNNNSIEEAKIESSSSSEGEITQPKQKENYKEKMKLIYKEFFDREERDLFVDIENISKLTYKSIPDLEIVLKNDAKLNSIFDDAIKKANDDIEYKEIDNPDVEIKSLAGLITKLSRNAFKKYQDDQIYADYTDNIELLFGIKNYLTDEKVIGKLRRDEIFPKMKKVEIIANGPMAISKKDIETIQTGKFVEPQIDDF